MARTANSIKVYLETGNKRSFAGAIDWPGWCRGGRDEASALQALLDYAPRYAGALQNARLGFLPPAGIAALAVAERLTGGSTTDFGAPEIAPSADTRRVDDAELKRLEAILKACWRTLDAAAAAARGKELRKGPRGGGRSLESIVAHVQGAEEAYLGKLGWKMERGQPLDASRQAALKALAAAAHGELPERGPRGGLYWQPRYFCRRAAWHVLDHAWEIQDRLLDEAVSSR